WIHRLRSFEPQRSAIGLAPDRDLARRQLPHPTENMDPAVRSSEYQKPSWLTKHLFNNLVGVLTRLGVSFWGSRLLRVRGRTSGSWHATPVNVLAHGGHRYLVAPRGETQWVRNLRASLGGELR